MNGAPRPRIGLIAGGGRFPLLVAQSARKKGYYVVVAAHLGETEPKIESLADETHWLRLGQINRLIKILKKAGVENAVLAGGVKKAKIFSVRPDLRSLSILTRLVGREDDTLLRAFASELEQEGISVVSPTLYLEDLLAEEGILVGRVLRSEREDLECGFRLAKEIGRLEVGQGVAVKKKVILAVEAIEGTDEMIRRAGAVGGRGAIVVKVLKPGQDERFDLPAVGPVTIETMARAKARVLGLEAGRTLLLDRQEMFALARKHGIAIVGLGGSGGEPAKKITAARETREAKRVPRREAEREVFSAPLIRVAVVGVGHLGQHHARIYAEMEGVELVGVVDSDWARAAEIAAKHGCAAFEHVSSLPSIDAASVAVPTSDHHAVGAYLLDRGADLLIEKPVTRTVEEADDLIARAARTGRIIQVGHVERFNRATRKLLETAQEVRFIECHRMAPFAERGTDVHVVLDLMIHDLDLILALVRSPVVEVRAVGVPVLSQRFDIASARVAFASGCVANVTASRVSLERKRKFRIFQRDTYISLDFLAHELLICRRKKGEDGRMAIVPERLVVEREEPLAAELSSFVHAVRFRKRPEVSAEDGREALRLAHAIVEEAEEQAASLLREVPV